MPSKPQYDAVGVWHDWVTGQAVTGTPNTYLINPFGWFAPELGQYRVFIQFGWDQSSSGAKSSHAYYASGWTPLTPAPHDCIFG